MSLVTLSVSSFYIGRIATNDLTNLSGETLYASAKSAADLLSLGLREKEKDIHLLSIVPNLKRDNLASDEIRTLLEIRKETYGAFAWLGVVNLQGIVLQATDNRLVGNDVSQRRWFKMAASRSPAAGAFHAAMLLTQQRPGKGSNEPIRLIDFAAPIFDENNQLRGVLSSHLLWDWVTNTIASAISEDSRRRGVEILISDQFGNILHPNVFGDPSDASLDWEQDEHYRIVDWDDGRQYLIGQASVEMTLSDQSEWRIIARQSADQAYAPTRELQRRLLALGVVTAIFFTVLVYCASSRISRPIEQLASAVRHIGKHEKSLKFPHQNKIVEIKQLSDSVQAMTASLLNNKQELETLNASLEKQVEDRTRDLLSANQALEKLATTDGLTQINNRRSFDERLREHFLLTKRGKENFSLLIIDIDFFKKVNDVHGHQIGDHVLQKLAQMLKENTRGTDFVARYGGEEFVVLLPNTKDEREAWTLGEKIRQSVEATPFPVSRPLTISIGVSCSHKDDQSQETIMQRADKALYAAKKSGRNRVKILLAGGGDLDCDQLSAYA